MKIMEQYRAAFSQVHTDATIRMEDYQKMKKSHMALKRAAVSAASLCLIIAGLGTVYAMDLFGLKDLVLGNKTKLLISTAEEDGTYVEAEIQVDMISLQGYMDSDEYKATAEWTEFLDSYDQDMALFSEVGNGPTGLDEKYDLYSPYTQEMADKLDEIVDKYGLTLHTTMKDYYSNEDLFQLADTGDFLGSVNKVASGYIYGDGTFRYDGTANLSNGKSLTYQFGNCKKGVFDEVCLNIGNEADYDEWTYETASGISVTIATSPNKAVLTADLNNSFVSINIFIDQAEITPAQLEALATLDNSSGGITSEEFEALGFDVTGAMEMALEAVELRVGEITEADLKALGLTLGEITEADLVAVGICPTETTEADLEAFADSINFSMLN